MKVWLVFVLGVRYVHIGIEPPVPTDKLLSSLENNRIFYFYSAAYQPQYTDWPVGVNTSAETLVFKYLPTSYGMQFLICTDGNFCMRQFTGGEW